MTARKQNEPRWLVFFYSVPSKPVKNRMSVWRRLMKLGAVQLKGTVYILPFSEGHLESLQWLASEIAPMGGEAAFLRTHSVEPMSNENVIALFNETRAREYQVIQKEFSVLERRLDSMKKGGRKHGEKALSSKYAKLNARIDEVLRTDFFNSPYGKSIKEKSASLRSKLAVLALDDPTVSPASITRRRIGDYQSRVWATRKRPFVDRMAAAWLVRKFIDPDAGFDFVEDADSKGLDVSPERPTNQLIILYDIQGGEFTHVGDLCTFEVMVKSFGVRDKAVHKIAETVHELDIKDGRYPAPGARGIEDILTGIRKASKDDIEALQKGMDVFEMLYLSLK